MKSKKFKGFLVTSFLVFILLIPSINGINIKRYGYENTKNLVNSHNYSDLQTYVNRLEYVRCEYIEGNFYSIYEADYKIKNMGTMSYSGQPMTRILDAYTFPTPSFDYWFEDYLELGINESINLSREVKILTSIDPDIDKERYFADHDIVFSSTVLEEWLPYPEERIVKPKYWSKKSSYEPTYSQILVSSPWDYKINVENVNYSQSYFLELKSISQLPDILKDRLGWVEELLDYLSDINTDIKEILQNYDELFLSQAWVNIEPILNWIINICNSFNYTIKNNNFPSNFEYLLKNVSHVNNNISKLSNLSVDYYGKNITEIKDLQVKGNNLAYWVYNSKPWRKPIEITSEINSLRFLELIEVSCRNKSLKFRDRHDGRRDKKIKFVFFAPAKPIDGESSYFVMHNCTMYAEGRCLLRRDRLFESNFLTSFCFSDGKINIDSYKEEWKKSMSFFFSTGLNKKNNRFFSVPIKNNNHLFSYKTKESDWVYKEYHPNAPTDDPNIVYYEPSQVIIRFKSSVDASKLKTIEGYPVIDFEKELNSVLINVSDVDIQEFINTLNKKEDIIHAELNLITEGCNTIPTDPHWDKQWGHRAINLPQAWDYARGGGVKIAILDTGLDSKHHEDIKSSKIIDQYDVIKDKKVAIDDNGHGTHNTGLIIANMFDEGIAGVSPYSKIILIKVLNKNNKGNSFNAGKGIIKAAESADIILMPFAFFDVQKEDTYLEEACEKAYNKGVLLIASAGNIGGDYVGIPARYDEVISVGAVDENLKRCGWNTHGPELDLMAPGKDIYSTLPDNTYGYRDGTSPAAAYVAGVAALYYDSHPGCTSNECKNKLLSSTVDLGDQGWDEDYGYGLIDASKVVKSDIVIDYSWAPKSPYVDEKVTFTSNSYDPDGDKISSYQWDFNGDGKYDKTGEKVTHVFTKTGSYNCKLIVTCENGSKAFKEKKISIKEHDFSWTPENPKAGDRVTFKAKACDFSDYDYAWDFNGDRRIDKSGPEVTHTYLRSGSYNCVLYLDQCLGLIVSRRITVSSREGESKQRVVR